MSNPKCVYCGRFISNEDLDNGKATAHTDVDTEFSSEDSYFFHRACAVEKTGNPWYHIVGLMPVQGQVERLEVRDVPISVQKQASPHDIGFWIYVNDVMIPVSAVHEIVKFGDADLIEDAQTRKLYLQGFSNNLRLWLPNEVFKNAHA